MSTLGPERRAFVAWLAERMIPRSPTMPGAADLSLAHVPLDRVLKHRPDLTAALDALPDRNQGETVDAYLSRLETQAAGAYLALLQAVLGAYYMHPEVKRRLGYHGQQALTLPRGGFGCEELLELVLSQPPRYRGPAR